MADPAHDVPTDPGPANNLFYPALDGLRAIAFLMVFGQHYLSFSWGWTGVDIFFVLSGFLITGILFDTRNKPHRVWNFYIRRTLRIFPLYYGVFLIVLLAYPIFKWRWSAWWLVWPVYLGNYARFIHPYSPDSPLQLLADAQPLSRVFPLRLYLGHFWSLCVEEQFYLVWPWLVFWIKDLRRLIFLCLTCVLVSPVIRLIGSQTLPGYMLQGEVLYRVTIFRGDALLLGGLIALLLRAGYSVPLLKAARIIFGICLATTVLWLAMNPYARTFRLRVYPDWKFTWGLSFIDLFAAAVIVMALKPGTWTNRILSPEPLRWIGRVSYSAYVLHDIPRTLYERVFKHYPGNPAWPVAGLGLVCTLTLAGLSYHFLETPFIRLKEKLSR